MFSGRGPLIRRSSAPNPRLIGGLHGAGMSISTGAPTQDAGGVLDLIRVLLLVQAAVLLASAVETSLATVFFSPAAAFTVLLTAVAAAVVLSARQRLGAGAAPRQRRARRLALVVQVVVLVHALVDLAIALLVEQRVLGPVPTLTWMVLPFALLVLLRRR
jgi:hypothetical protein